MERKMMAALYDVDVRTINEHLQTVFSDGDLVANAATIRNFRIVQTEGERQVSRETKHYNLQTIIAVGFKVNNPRAVQFRKWAGQIVKDYTIQGWTMDVERLKKGHGLVCHCLRLRQQRPNDARVFCVGAKQTALGGTSPRIVISFDKGAGNRPLKSREVTQIQKGWLPIYFGFVGINRAFSAA